MPESLIIGIKVSGPPSRPRGLFLYAFRLLEAVTLDGSNHLISRLVPEFNSLASCLMMQWKDHGDGTRSESSKATLTPFELPSITASTSLIHDFLSSKSGFTCTHLIRQIIRWLINIPGCCQRGRSAFRLCTTSHPPHFARYTTPGASSLHRTPQTPFNVPFGSN